MEFIQIIEIGITRMSSKWKTAFFLLVKNPIYHFLYNKNTNVFRCNGIIKGKVRITGENNVLIIKKGALLNNVSIVIRGKNNQLVIHEDVIFHENGRIKLEDEGNLIEIGEGTNIMGAYFAVSDYNSKLKIGKRCLLSKEIVIRNSDVHSILDRENKRVNHARDTIVNDHVWVGYGATILKGCVIGENSVVGTQSVVANMTVAPNCIVAGNPGKIIRTGIHWCMERKKR